MDGDGILQLTEQCGGYTLVQKAAVQGDAKAQSELHILLEQGRGISQSSMEAANEGVGN